ncbi:MAG: ABC transporter permease subunit [Lysinibacillus sp.]
MFNILKKELKDSFRDGRTLVLTVVLPLLLMSGLVFFYENLMSTDEEEVYEVVVEQAQYEFLTTLLEGNDSLEVTVVEDVEKTLEDGKAVAGIKLPANFEAEIAAGATPSVQILGDDYSQNSMIAMTAIEMAFASYSQTLVAERLAESNVDMDVLTPFVTEKVQIVEGDNSVMMISFLVPLMLSIAIGIGISPSAADLIAGEKERRTMEALLMTPVNRSSLLFAKWLTMIIVATLTGILTLAVVLVEIQFFTEQLKAGIALGDQVLPVAITALLVVISFSAFMASALMLTSIMAKTVKEAQSYSTPIVMISVVPAMFVMNIGLNELTTSHFAIPIMNIFTIFKELFLGVINVEHILIAIGVNLAAAIVLFLVGRVMFLKDKWVLA